MLAAVGLPAWVARFSTRASVTILDSTLTGNTAQGGNGAARWQKLTAAVAVAVWGRRAPLERLSIDSHARQQRWHVRTRRRRRRTQWRRRRHCTLPFGTGDNGTPGGFGGGGGGGYGFGGFQSGFIPFYGQRRIGGFGGGGGGGGSGDYLDTTPAALAATVDSAAVAAAAEIPPTVAPGGGFGGGTGQGNNGGGGAGMGGAIFNYQGSVIITNSTLEGNNAFARQRRQ